MTYELLPAACHVVECCPNNPEAWLWPMRGLKRLRSPRVLSIDHTLSRISGAGIVSHGDG